MNDMNYDYKFFEFLGIRINNNNEKLQELLKDENVRKFINILEENKRLGLYIKNEMEGCSHVFVRTKATDEADIYHCLKCGLTNEYAIVKQNEELTEFEKQITDTFSHTFTNGMIINDGVCNLSIAKEVYDFIKRNNLSISHAELEKAFLHAYPKFAEMRERGTLGKCKTKKSAAEQWYEMEERCHDSAIATLNKILEEKQGKTK